MVKGKSRSPAPPRGPLHHRVVGGAGAAGHGGAVRAGRETLHWHRQYKLTNIADLILASMAKLARHKAVAHNNPSRLRVDESTLKIDVSRVVNPHASPWTYQVRESIPADSKVEFSTAKVDFLPNGMANSAGFDDSLLFRHAARLLQVGDDLRQHLRVGHRSDHEENHSPEVHLALLPGKLRAAIPTRASRKQTSESARLHPWRRPTDSRLRRKVTTSGFFSRTLRGAAYPWRGLFFLWRHPRLSAWAAIPCLANVLAGILPLKALVATSAEVCSDWLLEDRAGS